MTVTPTTVFVSGATGFIAQHIVKLLIDKGYNVVGTVRSSEKGENLKKLLNSNSFSYEIVKDVEPAGAFDEALKNHPEVTVFLHTASPFHFKASDAEKELLKPAVNGTKNALNAIKTYGPQIKHVVVTSSYAAIMNLSKGNDPSHVDTEELWNPITWEEAKLGPGPGYVGSKTFAEKAAWDFVKDEKPNFTINYINPVYVFGPQTFDSEVKDELNTSSEIINGLLNLGKDSDVPETAGSFVDVRDVAKAHLVAFEKNLSNQRLLMTSSKFNGQDLLDVLNARFESLKNKLPIGNPGSGKEAAKQTCQLDNSKTREILGFPLIDLETSVVDTVAQILKARGRK
ncbi:NAD(P)-binding protein [Metschnikowia bicuspidata var. bicuspidata NRRL YB-4993]|uniref:NAD(P)-binding protein n=1 Tax=Metschnikowia bicuspidata var. bicuspidata NRRL YB-4993 TaxID=869754 RepID=A0A1A0HEK0_9ASCO|nr:NAD(P)-binding protein [Metschnikowia bicuspidata var. bicuspidata NRRL YB-4993]OBA22539.1 NAD(P)-binding protein [Metschnikowia bicuspidata var. bicuspidata NRRL YB-4993]